MDEIQRLKQNNQDPRNKEMPLRVIGYSSFILSVIFFALYFFGGSHYCFSKSISVLLAVPFLIFVAVSIFVFAKLRKGIFIAILCILVCIGVLSAVSLSGPTPKGRDAYIKSDMNSIADAQDLYFEDNNQYATTFDQLTENYLSGQFTTNPFTNKPYVLVSDGSSWSIQADLFSNDYELCGRFGAKQYIYSCSASSGKEAVCKDVEK